MKRINSIILAACFTAVPAIAQVSASPQRFSPLAAGYLERARTMSDAGNYAGVIDQLLHLDTQMVRLTPDQTEEYTFLLAEAYYHRDDADCLRLLIQFRNTYPASPLAPKAALAIGDFYFFRHQWAEALEAYGQCDLNRLNRDDKILYSYRRALCLIRTGHFNEARPLISALRYIDGYKDAYNFYTAYLDYIDGKFNDAYNRFKKVPEGIKGLDAGYYMAQIEYSRGEYRQVITRGMGLLRNNPDPELEPEIDRIVGLSYFKTRDYANSYKYLTDYLSTTQSVPEPDALYALGAIDYSEGRYNAAVQRLSEVSDLENPIGQGAWLYLGQCYLKQDKASAAALAFEKASKMDYDSKVTETAYYNYITALTNGGKVPFASSSQMLEDFVRKYPDSKFAAGVEKYLATAYYNDRKYAKALKFVESVKNPTSELMGIKQKILYEMGIEAVSNGRPQDAVGYLKQCVEMRKYDRNLAAQAALWLGDAYMSLDRYKDAASSYQTFVKEGTTTENRALGYYDLAYALYKTKDYSGAASNFANAINTKPGLDPRLLNDARIRRADCLYYIGKTSEASRLYSEAISNGATDSDYALYRRAMMHGLEGDSKAKLEDLSKLMADYPDSRWLSKALLEMAVTYEETGDAARAADAYKKRLEVAEDVDTDELLRMAEAMNQAGRWSDLLEVVDRIRHSGGIEAEELAEIDLYEADALAGEKRYADAREIYGQLAENPASLPGAKGTVMMAEIDIRNGNYESAREILEEFTDKGSPHQYWLARGFIALADAYRGLGDTSLAREYILSLRENYPGSESDIKNMINNRLNNWK